MRIRLLLVTGIAGVALVASALAGPAQASRELKGSITSPQAPAWTGLFAGETGTGGETLTAYAFALACQQDRDAHAAGDPASATHIAEFLASPENGLDGYVWDLGAPVEGFFEVKGPGATVLVPDAAGTGVYANDYDLDLDFFAGAEVNAAEYDHTDGGVGCPNANRVDSSHKCYSHTQNANEKSNCQAGYKVGKVKHLPRYVMVSGSFNLKGPMDLILTAP